MKNSVLSAIFLLFGFVFVNGQQTNPTPTYSPVPTPDVRVIIRNQQEANRRFDGLRNGRNSNVDTFRLRQIFFQTIEPLYRKPTREELNLLAPNSADMAKYADFLKQSNTGITRLIIDLGCADNPNVVSANPHCLKYTMPGAGSSFSFRTNTYRIRRLADLTYSKDGFHTTGIWLHGVLVNLGDVPLEQISLMTKGVKFISDFAPVSDYKQAAETERQISAGITNDGFLYGGALAVQEDATYILRSIAYRGSVMRAVQSIAYNELDFDKRKDILVTFRIIRKDDESITILWKEINSKKSPKIEIEDEEENKPKQNNLVAETE
mgnify:CR=1 FL=1